MFEGIGTELAPKQIDKIQVDFKVVSNSVTVQRDEKYAFIASGQRGVLVVDLDLLWKDLS